MASLSQALANIKKYGLTNAIKGAYATPGGYLGPAESAVDPVTDMPEWQRLGYRSEPEYWADTNNVPAGDAGQLSGLTGPELVAASQRLGQTADGKPILSSKAGTTTRSGSAAGPSGVSSTPDVRIFQGRYYDFNNPNDRARYFNDRASAAKQYRDQYVSDAESSAKDQLAQGADQYANEISQLDTNLADIQTRKEKAGKQAVKDINDLGQSNDLGTVKRQAYFTGLSPNAYQSSQGSSEQFAKDQLDKGIQEVRDNLAETGKQYDTQTETLNKNKGSLKTAYDLFTKGVQDYISKAYQTADNYLNEQKDSTAEAFGPLDRAQGVNPFRYDVQAYNPYAAPTVDLSKYTKFTNFDQLAGSPEAQIPETAKRSTIAQADPSLSEFLGYQPDAKETNYLRRYLTFGG